MTTYNEAVRLGDVVKFELPMHFCRGTHTIEQDAGATAGLVVGECLEDSGGKEIVVATGANCNAILLEDVLLADLIAGDTTRVCLIRGSAIVDTDQLTCATAQKAAAVAALLALGILVRSEPTYTTL